MDQRLEVEVWQFVHDAEHDIFKEFIINLWGACQNLEITSMLGQASIDNGVVLVVSVYDGIF